MVVSELGADFEAAQTNKSPLNLSRERNRCKRTIMTKSGFDAEFDVVVVGAGSAGCVLSARLTENPNISLCVIEAGGSDRKPRVPGPSGFGKLSPHPAM